MLFILHAHMQGPNPDECHGNLGPVGRIMGSASWWLPTKHRRLPQYPLGNIILQAPRRPQALCHPTALRPLLAPCRPMALRHLWDFYQIPSAKWVLVHTHSWTEGSINISIPSGDIRWWRSHAVYLAQNRTCSLGNQATTSDISKRSNLLDPRVYSSLLKLRCELLLLLKNRTRPELCVLNI